GGLMITFHQPAIYFSLLFAELFSDAGCCSSDPIYLYVFSPEGSLIDSVCVDCHYLAGFLGDPTNPEDSWPYWKYEINGEQIGRIIVGGESEPTTIDRLEFSLEISSIPEPDVLKILFTGLILLLVLSFYRSSSHNLPV